VNSIEGPELALCDWQLFCNAEYQQQRSLQENWDQQSQLHVTPQ